jgi:hypothetical protein
MSFELCQGALDHYYAEHCPPKDKFEAMAKISYLVYSACKGLHDRPLATKIKYESKDLLSPRSYSRYIGTIIQITALETLVTELKSSSCHPYSWGSLDLSFSIKKFGYVTNVWKYLRCSSHVQYPTAYYPGTPEVNLAFSWSEMTREKMYLLTYVGNLLYIYEYSQIGILQSPTWQSFLTTTAWLVLHPRIYYWAM